MINPIAFGLKGTRKLEGLVGVGAGAGANCHCGGARIVSTWTLTEAKAADAACGRWQAGAKSFASQNCDHIQNAALPKTYTPTPSQLQPPSTAAMSASLAPECNEVKE